MTHPLLVGYFEHRNGMVRMGLPEEGCLVPAPVVLRPLDAAEVEAAVREVGGDHLTLSTIPSDWGIHLDASGVLVGTVYTKNCQAVEFLARVAERTGAEIWADGGQRRLDPQQVVREWVARKERARVLLARVRRGLGTLGPSHGGTEQLPDRKK